MWEMWVRSLGGEDPLVKKMATHSQYFCLENSMDRGVWRATIHRVAKSQTQLNDGVHTHTHTHTGLSQGQYDKVFKIFCTQRVLEKG